ncbi:ATP-dependent DNA helicase RecQ [Prolixibacter bellariivorans]|uniref:DNA helicase RecQ n=1 Tax=Prolixibacter bellariivorans TaxID=314319 RepID=A0A5M4B478_9BACT|nr:DNA helicase RecQ [Prolixibacter bellariivorans]GET34924.1 ATP-dependent DNA helicase RecQ [Prolixibacter bellariivorans]
MIYETLRKYFGYETFRPLQEEIIQAILDGHDCLAIMPTGGGKSLCFQLPALVQKGTAIVVSPLISLMKDQVDALRANGIGAAYLNSTISPSESIQIFRDVISGKIKLLYVSPEKLLSQDFYRQIKTIDISLFAIDEAHCISQWGHDFRPEYTQLNFLSREFKAPIIALTATADRITRSDIIQQLGLRKPQTYISSFDRENLSITVLPGREKYENIKRFIGKRKNQSGIIYCLSRKQTEQLANKLNGEGLDAVSYHAGMKDSERQAAQEDFINDRVQIVCATVAFGMGIDKPNVRWVIHYNLPKNLESYYQEIGRAGRDGLPADTLLFYSYRDVLTLKQFIEESTQKDLLTQKLERMQQFADARTCRRRVLLNYFNEAYDEDCGNCDVCQNPPAVFDGTVIAQKALSAIARVKEQISSGLLIDILRGSARKELIDNGWAEIKTYGAGRDISYRDWQEYLLQLLNMGLFEVAYNDGNKLKLTSLSRDVLFDGKKINLVSPEEAENRWKQQQEKKQPQNKVEELDNALFEHLRSVRKELAAERNVPPYIIFSDATLKQMATSKPITEFAMRQISGVGEFKYEQFGIIFIRAIMDFNQFGNTNEKQATNRYQKTYDFLKKGYNPEEIAERLNLNIVTVCSHLAYLYESDYDISLQEFLEKKELQKIEAALLTPGLKHELKPIYDHLNGEIPYHKIRLGLSIAKKEQD